MSSSPADIMDRKPAAAPQRMRPPSTSRASAQPAPTQVTLRGELLYTARLRVSSDGAITTVSFVLAQPGDLPPVCADFQPTGGQADYIVWRNMLHHYAPGTRVRIDGRGLRQRTLNGRRVLVLGCTDSVQLLQPPFDGRTAAAGGDA